MPNSNLSAPSALDYLIKSREQRIDSGIGEAYADTYNTAWQNDYQLALQEYLYNKYQSPAAMARQFEEAGINRNFASQSGGDIHSPQNDFKSNISQARSQSIQNTLGIINSALNLVKTGVDTVSDVTNLPKDLAIKEYQKTISQYGALISAGKSQQQQWDVLSSMMKGLYNAAYYGGADVDPGAFDNDAKGISWDAKSFALSPALRQAQLRNALMDLKVTTADWDFQHLKPAQLEQVNEMIENVAKRTSFLGLQQDLYVQLKSAGLLAPIILSLLKML